MSAACAAGVKSQKEVIYTNPDKAYALKSFYMKDPGPSPWNFGKRKVSSLPKVKPEPLIVMDTTKETFRAWPLTRLNADASSELVDLSGGQVRGGVGVKVVAQHGRAC